MSKGKGFLVFVFAVDCSIFCQFWACFTCFRRSVMSPKDVLRRIVPYFGQFPCVCWACFTCFGPVLDVFYLFWACFGPVLPVLGLFWTCFRPVFPALGLFWTCFTCFRRSAVPPKDVLVLNCSIFWTVSLRLLGLFYLFWACFGPIYLFWAFF